MVAPSPDVGLGTWDARRIVRTMFPLLMLLSLIVLWAGITLEEAAALLDEYRLLAVMVPTMIAMGGNLGAILSARLSTRFHLGTTDLSPRERQLWIDVGTIVALAATVFTALAVGAWLLGHVLGYPLPLPALLIISLVSGLSLALVAVVFSIAATYGSYRFGVDPDDATIPVVTNVVDVFGMLIFIGVSTVVLGF